MTKTRHTDITKKYCFSKVRISDIDPQKISFIPNWMIRGSRADVARPKLLFPKSRVGCPQFGWLNALKNSLRNCSCIFSRIRKFLKSARSTTFVPGPVTVDRPALPKRSAGATKQLALKNVTLPLTGLRVRSLSARVGLQI